MISFSRIPFSVYLHDLGEEKQESKEEKAKLEQSGKLSLAIHVRYFWRERNLLLCTSFLRSCPFHPF
jgi:hypothetical protein